MKKCAVWVILLGAAFSLFAQNTESATIFVPPVTGTGITPDDNAALTDILIRELKSRNLVIKDTQEDADYALIGTLSPSNANYMLSLAMQDKNGLILYEQTLFYTTLEEANIYISAVLLNMLSNIFIMHVVVPVDRIVYVEKPEERAAEDPDAWRNKQWYIGANVFWNPRIYYGTRAEFFPFNFGWGLSADFNLQKYGYGEMVYLKYLALGTGIEFTSDWVVATAKGNDDYRNTVMQIPITFYGVFKPGDRHLLQPYLGIFFNIPFFPETVPPVLSWKTGFQYGMKAGRGIAYADTRFSMDFGKSGFNANSGDTRRYDRFMIYTGVGYKHDLIEVATATKDLFVKIIQDIKANIAESEERRKQKKHAGEPAPETEAAVEELLPETEAASQAWEPEPEAVEENPL